MKRIAAISLTLLLSAPVLAQGSKQRQEDSEDYYRKWLAQDVLYIITDEEREIFSKLTTEDSKDQFIEQFWHRRDPNPRSSQNEFKTEHYRRIAYANEKFGSGIPGWKTDRGRTYITFGPPDILEDHPSGGWYYRKIHEGGGATSTYPFQLWIYNHIEGIGDEVEVEFVDPSWSGEYRIAMEPWEKDALLTVGFSGPTDAELEGTLSKLDRPYFSPGNYRNTLMQRMLGMRAKDKPFERVLRYYKLQDHPEIRYDDLKQIVQTRITYHQIPFEASYEYLIVNENAVLAPVTIEFQNRTLTFEPDGKGLVRGQVNIYGIVQNLSGRIITEFEDTLTLAFPEAEKEVRLQRKSIYQKVLPLTPGRYKVTLAAQDDNSNHTATATLGLHLPSRSAESLDASSMILARVLQYIEQAPDAPLPFMLGDLKVIPNVTRTFHQGDSMGLYLQIYNAGVDQSSQRPDVEVEYQIWKADKIVKSVQDPKSGTVVDYGDRLVLVQGFPLSDLPPGGYTLKVKLRDRVGRSELNRQVQFNVVG